MEAPTNITFDQLPAAMQWLVNEVSEIKKNLARPCLPVAEPPSPVYLTRKEVATKLYVSLNTLDTYAQAGTLKAYRVGTRILFKAAEVDQALKAMKSTAA